MRTTNKINVFYKKLLSKKPNTRHLKNKETLRTKDSMFLT